MSVVVLVPRRGGDEWRDRLWDYTRRRWLAGGFRVVEGHHDDGPFNRSAAINTAAHDAGDWTTAVITDADTIVAHDQICTALGVAVTQRRAVLAYDELVSLHKDGTEQILDGYQESWRPLARWTNSNAVSSCVVVPRTLWDEVGGFDERFRGWGFEDRAFYLACDEIGEGVARVAGPAWHLWHPRSVEKNPKRAEYQANRDLAACYRAARRQRTMRRLLAER